METASIIRPGQGWATSKKRLVTLDENGGFITKSDTLEGFSGSFPSDFVRNHCEKKSICFPFTNKEFGSTIINVLRSYFAARNIADEFDELLQTGRSNGREMKWDIMTISPNTSFKLHAHPNIEIIYVIDGAIHELRYEVCILHGHFAEYVYLQILGFVFTTTIFFILLQGLLTKKYISITDMCGPNLSEESAGFFEYRSTRAKAASDTSAEHTNFLVNEKGSVHQSFSREDVRLHEKTPF